MSSLAVDGQSQPIQSKPTSFQPLKGKSLNNDCICGAELDTVYSAINRANKLAVAYKDLESKFQTTAQKGIDIAKAKDQSDKDKDAAVKDRDRLKKGRNLWRWVSVSGLVGLGISLLAH